MSIGDYVKPATPRQAEYYWKIVGEVQSDMKCHSDMSKMEKYTKVLGVEWGVHGPTDIGTGQRTGRLTIAPMVIVKPVDQSSPLLMQALCNNEHIKEAEFWFMDIPGVKTTQQKLTKMFSVKGERGSITKIDGGSTAEGLFIERIEIYFDRTSWRHEIGQTEYTNERRDSFNG